MTKKNRIVRNSYVKKVENENKKGMKKVKCLGYDCGKSFYTDNKFNKLCKNCKNKFYF